ncbi:MAG: cation:proton antiporter [Myxococcales bacterium]|nr:cation:proton antiporter [Myxococcales bacterium]
MLVAGGTVLVLGVMSALVKNRLIVSEGIVALAVGVLLGPAVLAWIHIPGAKPHHWLGEVARLTLAVALLATSLRLPRGFLRERARSVTVLLAVAMPVMWLVASGLASGVLGVDWLTALLIGGILTPTDPVVASSIVTGRIAGEQLPARLRHILSCEAGANDALAHPLIFLPVALLEHAPATAAADWLLHEIVVSTLGGALLGALVGFGTARAVLRVQATWGVERPSHLTITLAMAVMLLGAGGLLGTNELLAVFVAGLVFKEVTDDEQQLRAENVPATAERFLLFPVFVFFGAALPWRAWAESGWTMVSFALAVLLLRRLPLMLILHRAVPAISGPSEARFAGWFGPIGVAALFYAARLSERLSDPWIFQTASIVIASSVVAHGVTATPLVRAFGRGRRAGGSEHALQP